MPEVYGNELSEIDGDGTELDRAEGNVRCFHDRWTNVYAIVGLQPACGGPASVLGSVVLNVAAEQIELAPQAIARPRRVADRAGGREFVHHPPLTRRSSHA